MQNKTHLVHVFRAAMIEVSDLYQDFSYLSYARDMDIAGSQKIILDDLERIHEKVKKLCKTAFEAGILLNVQDLENSIQQIKQNLLQINSLADIDKYVLYRDGELFQNDLIDDWVYKLEVEVHQLYYKVCEQLENQTLFPFWDKFPNTLTYYHVIENPQAAIQQAFTFFEDYLRKRINAGPDLFGEELINKTFGKNGELTYSQIPAEQVGARNLLSGVYATFRNPNMHRITEIDEKSALAILSLIYTMYNIVEKSQKNIDN